MPAKVFLSHIHEEAAIAKALKELIEKTFLKQIDVFVSSSPQSNKPGDEWLEKIKKAIMSCDLAVILTGPHSYNRRWINFEGGTVWGRQKPVIPLCHSGLTVQQLGLPLSMMSVLFANNEEHLKLLFERIAELIEASMPEVDFSNLLEAVATYETESKQMQDTVEASPIAPRDGLLPMEIMVLAMIAEDPTGVTTWQLKTEAPKVGLMPVKAILAAKMLLRKGLVREAWYEPDGVTVTIVSSDGWEWLENNHELIQEPSKPKRPPVDDGDIPF